MLDFDIDGSQLERIADAFGATERQVDMASKRAARRTAGTIRRISSTGLQSELGLRNATALRRRIKTFSAGRRGSSVRLWYGANDLPISAFPGRPRRVPGGIEVGGNMIHGGFFARMGGRRRIMVRQGSGRWNIAEATLPVADRMMIYLEDRVFVDVGEIFMRNFVSEVEARTMLDAQNG